MNNKTFSKIIEKFLTIKDKENNNLNMNSIIISDYEGNSYKHLFKEEDNLHPVRSVCKSVVSLCYGLIINNEKYKFNNMKLSMETKVWPIIKNIANLTNKENEIYLEELKLIHLFTHTIGFDVKLLKSKDIKNVDPSTLVDLVINTKLVFKPGEYFLYSNAAPFLLSVIFQEVTKQNLGEFANEHIFKKLDIKEYTWRNYSKYCAGATGLELKSDDLHKIALLIVNKGIYKNNQIVPKSWIDEMIKIKVYTPANYDPNRVFPKYGYGLLMWICGEEEDSNYFIDGSEGQYIIVIPKKKLIITTLGSQKDMKPITICLKELLN